MKRKAVLITGASRGLGMQLAQKFFDENYDLILHNKESEFPKVEKSF